MTADRTPQDKNEAGWLAGRSFDRLFIFGTASFALAMGLLAAGLPGLLIPVLIVNLWALGYHHVIATFTRLCFDAKSRRRSLLLVYALLPAVLGLALFLAKTVGPWILTSLYLYVQWFHYARQSWGISRAYERGAPAGRAADRSWQTQAVFYGLPVLGILRWSYLAPPTFLGLELKVIPVPLEAVAVAGAACAILLAVWLVRIGRDWRRGVLPRAYTYYMASHFAVFIAAYLLMPSLDTAWIVVSIWHNSQYLLFVWSFNERRYQDGVSPEARFLSFISQRRNAALYFALTLGLTVLVYGLVDLIAGHLLAGMPFMVPVVLIYQSVNFHHYIVDAIIWRRSWVEEDRPELQVPGVLKLSS